MCNCHLYQLLNLFTNESDLFNKKNEEIAYLILVFILNSNNLKILIAILFLK
jgi:hypothetical protein